MTDFKRFPELTNAQMDFYYFDSPHRQITRSFLARVVKIIDGDTIKVLWSERKFAFPVRLAYIEAPELEEQGGLESALFLKREILGEEVYVRINPKFRTEKFGRILGDIIHDGLSINRLSIVLGYSKRFPRNEFEFW